MTKTFQIINFGCRVNAAESNQFAQTLIDQDFHPSTIYDLPSIIFINTCAITNKGEYESLSKVRSFSNKYPKSQIIVSGCANFSRIKDLKNIILLNNQNKEETLQKITSAYSPQIKDKYTNDKKYLLKIQSGCTANCSYCIVPQKRPKIWSLPIDTAIDMVNSAVKNNYRHLIITGINLNLYKPGLFNLLEAILNKTPIPLISFGSLPLLCIDSKFINLLSTFHFRLSSFLHIPIQSGSNKILKLMHRPYTKEKIIKTFYNLKSKIYDLKFGTDIIVGFPGETDTDFQETYDLCKSLDFAKIHTFRFSSRPNTLAATLYRSSPKIPKNTLLIRSRQIRSLVL